MEQPGIAKLEGILEEIREIDDRELKSELLIEFAERFVPVPESVARRPYSQAHRAPACESDAYAWLVPEEGERVALHFAVENPQGLSAKALASVLTEGLSGASRSELYEVRESIVEDLFGRQISMGKGEGLRGMVRLLKHLAAQPAKGP